MSGRKFSGKDGTRHFNWLFYWNDPPFPSYFNGPNQPSYPGHRRLLQMVMRFLQGRCARMITHIVIIRPSAPQRRGKFRSKNSHHGGLGISTGAMFRYVPILLEFFVASTMVTSSKKIITRKFHIRMGTFPCYVPNSFNSRSYRTNNISNITEVKISPH